MPNMHTLEAPTPPITPQSAVETGNMRSRGEELSGSQVLSLESLSTLGPTIKNIEWQHIPENGELTANLAADCDVLAVELVAENEYIRRKIDAAATTIMSSNATPRRLRKAERYLQDRNDSIWSVVAHLKGTDKRLVTIDISGKKYPFLPSNSQEYTDAQAFLAGPNEFERAVEAGRQSSEVKPIIATWAKAYAASNAYRENHQIAQVEALAEEYRGTNVKIGVLVGAVHTATGHELARRYPTERVFAVQRGENFGKRERMHYSLDAQLVRQQRFSPEKHVPEKLLNKLIIGAQYLLDLRAEDVHVLDRMTETELSETVLAIDSINAAVAAGRKKRSEVQTERRTRITTLLRSKFDEIERRSAR
jgi:hypothetical protein